VRRNNINLQTLSEEENDYEEDLEDLLAIREVIASDRYCDSAGWHDIDILEAYNRDYPDTAFLMLFRIYRASFWQVVEILVHAGGGAYWAGKVFWKVFR